MNNFVGLSKIGLVRQRNEDRFFIDGHICAVTDGMGGYSGGEIASTYAVDEIKEYLSSLETIGQQDLCDAIIHANQRIVNRVACEERLAGMGTTAVVTAINGHLRQITTDHSMVQELLTAGEITKDEMLNHPQRNLLTRAVGVDEILEVDSGVESILPGDRILLCTDGLSGYVSDDVIASALQSTDDDMLVIESLMEAVYEVGAGDNVTIVVGTI